MILFFISLFLFITGLCVGSFVNVAVFRSGFSERAAPRSRCMSCEAAIPWYDLVPIVSFLFLRGRCRACGSGLSWQYPFVEFSVGILFALSTLLLPPSVSLPSLIAFTALLIFLAALTGLVAYDLRHTLVPMPFVYVLVAAAATASLAQSFSIRALAPLSDSALGGMALFLFFLGVSFFTRSKGMGEGDAYVALAIGILLGFSRGIEAVMLGIWIGTAFAIILLLLSSLSKKFRLSGLSLHATMKTELPLVPFLALGTALALFTDLSPLSWAASATSFLFHP